jgi:NADH-quinone oxidoreductase subunit G
MSEQNITIEVDGQSLAAKPGQMLIEVTDQAGVNVPRFCYHKHLSVAANCRMCLVEVEGAPKPLPACATPCNDGMKVFTRSPIARQAQKGTMEFLLINHPLDCPICDQGGECELQDVAMGYGGDVSRFTERKRVVKDENIGSLIATDMTRCIHCTRCVRFGGEVAGLRELGATGRGEHMRIGMFIEKSVASELSGNVIDLCPVGALTSKPYRFTARAWELTQQDTIAPHDGVGSNMHLHLRRGEVMRAVPKENDACNQTWISDRDRFSYQGLYSQDRLTQPMVRENGSLKTTSWEEALQRAAKEIKDTAPERLGLLASPNATLEELYLSSKLMRGLGSNNIDHRLRQCDFRADSADPALPWLGRRFADIENNDLTVLIGSWLRKDQPLLNHRVRQSVREGAAVIALNPVAYDFNYDLDVDIVATPADMVAELAAIAQALGTATEGIAVNVDAAHQAAADLLKQAEKGSIILGTAAMMHPDFALLRRLAANIAEAAGLDWGTVGFGANDTGAWLAGAVPHRAAGGAEASGLNATAMQQGACDTLVLLNVEPEADVADPQQTAKALNDVHLVVLSTYLTPQIEAIADVVLPIAAFVETSGTYINLQADAQSFAGACQPLGEARPGWKVLRVLGNLLNVDGFDYLDSNEVRDEVLALGEGLKPGNQLGASQNLSPNLQAGGIQRIGGVPVYASDAIVRRAPALNVTPDAWADQVRMGQALANKLGVQADSQVSIQQGDGRIELNVCLDDAVPDDCIWLPSATPSSAGLGCSFANVSVEKV